MNTTGPPDTTGGPKTTHRRQPAHAERRATLTEREAERERLGAELAVALRALNEGGALDALTTLQRVLAQEQAMLAALSHRYEAAQALEASRRSIAQERL